MTTEKILKHCLIWICIMMMAVSCSSSNIWKTMREFYAVQYSFSEIRPSLSYAETVAIAENQEITEPSLEEEHIVSYKNRCSGAVRHLLCVIFIYLTFLAVLLRQQASVIYLFSCSPPCERSRVLSFILKSDGEK